MIRKNHLVVWLAVLCAILCGLNVGLALAQSEPPCCYAPGALSCWPGEGNGVDILDGNTTLISHRLDFVPGVVGEAFELHGDLGDEFNFMGIKIDHNPNLDPGLSSFSLEAWVKTEDTVNTQVIFSKFECGYICAQALSLYNLRLIAGVPRFAIRDFNGVLQGLSAVNSIADGNWHHLVATLDREDPVPENREMRIYVDCEEAAVAQLDPLFVGPITDGGEGGPPDDLTIGGAINLGLGSVNSQFTGSLDQLAFYLRALTLADVTPMCPTAAAGLCVPTVRSASINIHPGSDPNSINTCAHGTTPVTIFGSDDLDVEKIDPTSLILASSMVKTVGKSDKILCSIADSGSVDGNEFDNLGAPDGRPDLTCHFMTLELTDLTDESTSADLSGAGCDLGIVLPSCVETDPGFFQFAASDAVNIVKDCN